MPSRRRFMTFFPAFVLALASLVPVTRAEAGEIRIKNFHYQDWFADTTFDLREDLKAAAAEGKFLVLLWEQKGCSYCKAMHEVAFRRDDIVSIAKEHFHVIQMDMRGARVFKDLDGVEWEEADLARSLHVTGTPQTFFIQADGTPVFRMPGYADPPLFKGVYEYVANRAFEQANFQDWAKDKGLF